MKHEKIYTKTEVTAKINKKGEPGKWEAVDDQSPEPWTETSLKRRSLKEQYPKFNSESEEEYQSRLKRIGEYALKDSGIEEPPKVGKSYPYGDNSGRLANTKVYGYRFDEHVPATNADVYNDIFAERQRSVNIRDAIDDEKRAREEGQFDFTTDTPRNYEKQKEVARHFVGPLDYRERTKYTGAFQDVGSGRYSLTHATQVERWKDVFLKSNQEEEDKIEDKIDGRMLEGFFHPLIRNGFFDSPDGDHPAATILTSDYDDFHHKADTAVFIPLSSEGESDGEVAYCPISFDLTIGHGDRKIAVIRKKFEKSHGLTDIEYPSTCLKKELSAMNNVPHFILCLPRSGGEFAGFSESLAGGQLPSQDIQNLINYQIYAQARYWERYWDNGTGHEEIRDNFGRIATHFGRRLGLETKGASLINAIHLRHPDATRFISELLFRP